MFKSVLSLLAAFILSQASASASSTLEEFCETLQQRQDGHCNLAQEYPLYRPQPFRSDDPAWLEIERCLIDHSHIAANIYGENIEASRALDVLSRFKDEFCGLLGSGKVLKYSKNNAQSLGKLLNNYYKFLVITTSAHGLVLKKIGGAFNNPAHAVSHQVLASILTSRTYEVLAEQNMCHFANALSRIATTIHANLKAQKMLPPGNPSTLLAVQKGGIGFTHDDHGIVSFFASPSQSGYYAAHLSYARTTPQPAFVYHNLDLVQEPGLIVTHEPNGMIKLLGYHGTEAEHPFTCTRLSLRVMTNPVTPLLRVLTNIFGDDLARSESICFMPLPRTQKEWQFLEWCLVEDWQRMASQDQEENQQYARKMLQMVQDLHQVPVDDLMEKLHLSVEGSSLVSEMGLLQDLTQAVPLESASRTVLAAEESGEKEAERPEVIESSPPIECEKVRDVSKTAPPTAPVVQQKIGQSKPAKRRGKALPVRVRGKVRTGLAEGKSNHVTPVKAAASEADPQVLFEAFKVNGRMKYDKVLQLLHQVAKNLPEGSLRTMTQRGSHSAVHGAHGGVTLVRPHGRRDPDLKPHVINGLLRQMLSLGAEEKTYAEN
ncbi:MAG: hypothetical protein ACK5O7_06390 [Holosporales bacterium]